ncbi:Emopamil-binding protein [Syncephalastrum racemosum]|uniref:Emopamil-binding protein n=1 Tax=Syncephalastrum racemosum TaxID=13706 RepID=A0A1X2H945_SYNRA|nr:Emopamil-binding protein [Syncephalastrum racemosum]
MPTIDTVTVYSLLAVAGLVVAAFVLSRAVLKSSASCVDRATFIWFAFDALTHFILEGSFVWHSIAGRTVNTGTDMFAALWREYAKADLRWGFADPTIVALEILTVVGVGGLCVYILILLARNDPARHYWITVASVAELYGGWMTFVPELLIGSVFLDTDDWFHHYVYLWFFNGIWVVIPVALMVHSYRCLLPAALPPPPPPSAAIKKDMQNNHN